jgi:hypothetical protein
MNESELPAIGLSYFNKLHMGDCIFWIVALYASPSSCGIGRKISEAAKPLL